MTILAFGLLLPNLLLFSTDDLDVYRKGGEAEIVISQGEIGRYTFHVIGWLLNVVRLDYNSYLILSISVFTASAALLYRVVTSILNLESSSGFIVGYIVFLTFGLNLDLFQFVFAYLQYGIAFACAAGAVWMAHHVRSTSSAVLGASALGVIGLGSYQLFAQLIVMVVLALIVSSSMCHDAGPPRHLRRTIGVSLLALVIGAALYLALNAMLKRLGVAGFAHYPVREQGLKFAWVNLPAYRRTLLALVGLSDALYRPLLPKLWRLAFVATILFAAAALWRRGYRRGGSGTLAIAAALVLWPNPANLFLADYWPSARSMSGFAIFIGLLCGAIFSRSRDVGGFGRFGRILVLGVAACQCSLMAIRYQDRFVQQAADVALAESILLRAYAEFPVDAPVAIDLAIAPEAVQTVKPLVLDYGRSMFATSWSAPAFLDHLSGHRVSPRTVDLGDCAESPTRLSYERRGDRLLVCLLAR